MPFDATPTLTAPEVLSHFAEAGIDCPHAEADEIARISNMHGGDAREAYRRVDYCYRGRMDLGGYVFVLDRLAEKRAKAAALLTREVA